VVNIHAAVYGALAAPHRPLMRWARDSAQAPVMGRPIGRWSGPRREGKEAGRPLADTQARLRSASQQRFRDFLTDIDLGALMLDRAGAVEFINDHLLWLLGRTREEVLGRDWIDVAVPESERPALRAVFVEAIADGRLSGHREDGITTRSGEELRLAWTSVVQRDANGHVAGLASIAYDVTSARRTEAERAVLAAAIEQSAESVMITDRDARITYVNDAFERISGYASDEVIGRNPRLLKSGVQPPSFYDSMWSAIGNGHPWVADMTNRRKDGSTYQVASVISPIRGADGSIGWFVASARDVSRERELKTRAETLARERSLITETLRSLPSGGTLEATAALFCHQVESLTDIAVASLLIFESDGTGVPLSFVAGDDLSGGIRRQTPERSRYLRDHALAGPWVETWVHDPGHPYAETMRTIGVRAFAYSPVLSDGSLIGVLAVGSARHDAVAQLSGQLGAIVDFADLAGALIGHRVGERRESGRLRSSIERIIAARAFVPVFQPIVDMVHGRTVGFEALTRFSDGVRPDVRFADAASIGLGIEIERATLEAALTAGAGLPRVRWLHLNVTPELVLSRVELRDLLRDTKARIVLEVTEHAPVADYVEFRRAIADIGRSVLLAVDDAGAGFASLRHILELRPAFVKLDLSLVRGIDSDPAKQALVAGMHHFAHTTGQRLIAEGVETEAEAAALRALDVRLGQGYLLGRPAPAAGSSQT
jgi:PAS domain S-box-containing protein